MLICVSVLAFVPVSHPEMTWHTFVTQEYANRTIWARNTTDCQALFLKEQLAREEEPRLACMGEYDFMSLRYAMADTLNLGLLQESWEWAPWTGDCEDVRRALEEGGYTHVFVAGLGDEGLGESGVIDARYAPLTREDEPLRENSLYRVVRDEQGGASLIFVATMPDMAD